MPPKEGKADAILIFQYENQDHQRNHQHKHSSQNPPEPLH
ncbi:hypothetical protein CSB95_4700 [Pseudomonas aeruginosa]|nr:hypothetical protein Y880_02918 [Pseudomonas aeruginosa PAK]AVJ90274.1 hypothetical protein CSB97_0717 [Pseudomonas aeruginosa]AVK24705.1 hypothetical protein CSB85_0545 [Pseudomonas aeruginosa]AWE81093.1 hypothetical protein CSC31_3207 [Pseudomonas aeruginosa]AWE86320.1 hypothetical protein CSC29_1084 [Pseudomonas aeruginosa]